MISFRGCVFVAMLGVGSVWGAGHRSWGSSSSLDDDPPCIKDGCKPAAVLPSYDNCAWSYVDFQVQAHQGTTLGACNCVNYECFVSNTGCNANATISVDIKPEYDYLEIYSGSVSHGQHYTFGMPGVVSGCGSEDSITLTIAGGPVFCNFTLKIWCPACNLDCGTPP